MQVDDAGLFLFGSDFHDEQKSKAGRAYLDNTQSLPAAKTCLLFLFSLA